MVFSGLRSVFYGPRLPYDSFQYISPDTGSMTYTSRRPQISVTATFLGPHGHRWSLVVGDHFGHSWSAIGHTLSGTGR